MACSPPNALVLRIVGGVIVLVVVWFGFERRRFQGLPRIRQVP